MEVFRDLGIEDEVNEKRTAQDYMGNNVFCTSLAGEELGRLLTLGYASRAQGRLYAREPDDDLRHAAKLLEPILVRTAASRGRGGDVQLGISGLTQDADGVTVDVRDYVAGDDPSDPRQICDRRRRRPLEGRAGHRPADGGKMGVAGSMNIVFEADLSKYVAHRPSVLYWVMQPGSDVGGIGMGLVRMVRPWHEWLIVWGYDINEPPPEVDGRAWRPRSPTI